MYMLYKNNMQKHPDNLKLLNLEDLKGDKEPSMGKMMLFWSYMAQCIDSKSLRAAVLKKMHQNTFMYSFYILQ